MEAPDAVSPIVRSRVSPLIAVVDDDDPSTAPSSFPVAPSGAASTADC
jgi:hypothetical protein